MNFHKLLKKNLSWLFFCLRVREGTGGPPVDVIKPDGMDDWGKWGLKTDSESWRKRQTNRQTEREKDSWMRGADEGYGTALCITDHQPGWLVLWVGVRGATPASHSVAMGLLPWQQQSNSLANITVGP